MTSVERSPAGVGGRHPGAAYDRALMDCTLYCSGERPAQPAGLQEAAARARDTPGAFVWIALQQPDPDAFSTVAAEFGLHPLAVEDAVKASQRPKLDVYRDHLFVVLRTLRYVDEREAVETGEVMLFVGQDVVVTVRHGEAADLDDVRTCLEARPDLLALGPSAVLWAVADSVVDAYAPAVDGLENDVDEVEDQVFEGRQNPTRRIYTLKRELMEAGRAVHPLTDVTARLASGLPGLADGTTELFGDVHDHVLRVDDRVSGLDSLLQSTLDANIAQVTLQQNEDMRKISAYAAILTVCTTIAGVYGMNFEHMPELGWQFGYPFALALMGGSGLALYRAFRRNSWL